LYQLHEVDRRVAYPDAAGRLVNRIMDNPDSMMNKPEFIRLPEQNHGASHKTQNFTPQQPFFSVKSGRAKKQKARKISALRAFDTIWSLKSGGEEIRTISGDPYLACIITNELSTGTELYTTT
jgi:hypothetical protein